LPSFEHCGNFDAHVDCSGTDKVCVFFIKELLPSRMDAFMSLKLNQQQFQSSLTSLCDAISLNGNLLLNSKALPLAHVVYLLLLSDEALKMILFQKQLQINGIIFVL
jgi:hypothetical protein|tara:strand:- start:268 stop:588 length:321 start_codon:yes stop_codon:yes gene_type:complete